MSAVVTGWHRFWFDFELPAARLVAFRWTFFSLLALDLWLQVAHTARLGAGGFNVSHLSALDRWLPQPTPAAATAGFLLAAWLAARVALGGGARWKPALAVLTGALYGWSQLDSYQHHYLIVLLLAVLAAAPLDPPAGVARVRSWALRLVLVQMSIVYFWSAVAKLDPAWIAHGPIATLAGSPSTAGAVFSLGTPLGVAAATLARAATVVGIAFHLGVELAGFRIGLFSGFMLALYLLVAPAGAAAVGGRPRWPASAAGISIARIAPRGALAGAALVALGLAATGALAVLPLPGATTAAAGIVVLGAVDLRGAAAGRRRRLVPVTLAAAALTLFAATTAAVRDHWWYRGGDLRRRGDADGAVHAYRTVLRIDPRYASGWVRLGDRLRARGEHPEALAAYRRAAELGLDRRPRTAHRASRSRN